MKESQSFPSMMRRKIAIIGGGIAGLTAGYLLNRRHDITLFEKTGRLGGNAYTHTTRRGEDMDIAVVAFGRAGYKNFYSLLDELKIETRMVPHAYMSLHNLDTGAGLYITPDLEGSRKQRFELFRPENLRTAANLFLGLRRAQALSKIGALEGRTLEEALGYIPEMTGDARRTFLCTLALLSSMEIREILDSPAEFFLEKLRVHHDVISPKVVYSVRCVDGGTQSYVRAMASHFRDKVILDSRISTVKRGGDGVTLVMEDGERASFDKVVLACNPDQALALLEKPSARERELLGPWRCKEGRVVVHRDHSSFPVRDLIQAYTFLYTDRNGALDVSVNGALWHMPMVDGNSDYISTQHPNFPIREELIELETVLRTPIFDFKSLPTVAKLPSLNGLNNSYFCGSWFGFGLHDDAVTSAIKAAELLGVPHKRVRPRSFLPVLQELLRP